MSVARGTSSRMAANMHKPLLKSVDESQRSRWRPLRHEMRQGIVHILTRTVS